MNLADLSRMTEEEALELIESMRWPDGVICIHCNSKKVGALKGKTCRKGLFQCYAPKCGKQFSVRVGSIFERSRIPLRDWIYVFCSIAASKKGISAHQIHRELGITYKTAWFMCHRVRYAIARGFFPKLSGTIEVDETYVGGKPKWYDYSKRGRGTKKTPVLALVARRSGEVHTKVLPDVTGATLKDTIKKHVTRSSRIFTDELPSYRGIGKSFQRGHHTVNHSKKQYARGVVNTNSAESFFSLLKRGVYGTFHHVSKKHLHRYCSEFGFRWSNRKLNDVERTLLALRKTNGKRMSYYKLQGKD